MNINWQRANSRTFGDDIRDSLNQAPLAQEARDAIHAGRTYSLACANDTYFSEVSRLFAHFDTHGFKVPSANAQENCTKIQFFTARTLEDGFRLQEMTLSSWPPSAEIRAQLLAPGEETIETLLTNLQYYTTQNNLEAAKRCARTIQERFPNDYRSYNNLTYLLDGEWPTYTEHNEAIARKIIEVSGNFRQNHFILVSILLSSSDATVQERALPSIQKILLTPSSADENPVFGENQFFELSELCQKAKRYRWEFELLSEKPMLYSSKEVQQKVHLRLAKMWQEGLGWCKNEFLAALHYFDAVSAGASLDPETAVWSANILCKYCQIGLAQEVLQSATNKTTDVNALVTKIAQDPVISVIAAGNKSLSNGRLQEAISQAENPLIKNSKDVMCLNFRTRVYIHAGDKTKLSELYRALAANGENFMSTMVYINDIDHKSAHDFLLEAKNTNVPKSLFLKAAVMTSMTTWSRTSDAVIQFKAHYENDPLLAYFLGIVNYINRGDRNERKTLLIQAKQTTSLSSLLFIEAILTLIEINEAIEEKNAEKLAAIEPKIKNLFALGKLYDNAFPIEIYRIWLQASKKKDEIISLLKTVSESKAEIQVALPPILAFSLNQKQYAGRILRTPTKKYLTLILTFLSEELLNRTIMESLFRSINEPHAKILRTSLQSEFFITPERINNFISHIDEMPSKLIEDSFFTFLKQNTSDITSQLLLEAFRMKQLPTVQVSTPVVAPKPPQNSIPTPTAITEIDTDNPLDVLSAASVLAGINRP